MAASSTKQCRVLSNTLKKPGNRRICLGSNSQNLSELSVFFTDCWSEVNRSADGKLVANATTFPSGMKALGDYLHGKGE